MEERLDVWLAHLTNVGLGVHADVMGAAGVAVPLGL